MSDTMPTGDDIRDRLAVSSFYLHPDGGPLDGRRIAQIREAGITRVEIDGYLSTKHYNYHDKQRVAEIASACKAEGVSVVSVHCPGISYNTEYEEIRRAVVKECILSARVGEELGAKLFIGHFGISEMAEKTICEMLAALDDCKIKLTVENGNDLNDYAAFVDRIGSDRLGMIVDIGHTRDKDKTNPFTKKDRARETMNICGDRLFHLHLHDFVDADHYPPFDGAIEWGEIFLALKDIDYKGWYMFECMSRISPEDTLKKVAAFPGNFAAKYS
jgi:sugar phosphate isomerase/epimerase